VEPLTPWQAAGEFGQPSLVAAIDATGTATVAWLRPLPDTRRISGAVAVETATARPGGRFAVQRVAKQVQDATRPALAVADDGWALLAVDGADGVAAYDRAPGIERFTPVPVPAPHGGDDPWFGGMGYPVAAIRDGGGALIAWRTGFGNQNGVAAATRTGAGSFTRPRAVAPAPRAGGYNDAAYVVLAGSSPPQDPDGGRLQAAVSADGRALLAWTAVDDLGAPTLTLRVVAGTLADGFGAPARLGSPLRSADAVAPLFLSDGRAALAWTDNATSFEPSAVGESHGRLHLALESAPTRPSPPPPRIALRAQRSQRLFASSPLRVRVRCDRACDIYATVRGSGSAVTASLSHAGRLALRLQRGDRIRTTRHRQTIQARRGRLRVIVRAAAPNGHRIATRSRTVRVRARPALPIARPTGVRARRDGDAITVTWRTAGPARRTQFIVEPRHSRHRHPSDTGLLATQFVNGRGRTRFRVRLRPQQPRAIRWVAVTAISPDDQTSRQVTTVPVRT
jgi:hypothetical protein